MALLSRKLTIVLLLSALTAASGPLFSLVSFGDDSRHLFFLEEEADSDDVEELSESKLVATLEPIIGLGNHAGFHAVCDDVNHQIDWLFDHKHAARAPPLG